MAISNVNKGLLIGAMLVATSPAQAASCMDLWIKRNSIYAEYGYCFATPLGQRMFGNENCYTNSPRLSARDRAIVEQIKREEQRRRCRVN